MLVAAEAGTKLEWLEDTGGSLLGSAERSSMKLTSILAVRLNATGRAQINSRNHGEIQAFTICRISSESPFHEICTPMQNRMNATTRRMPCAVAGGMTLVIVGA